MITEDTAKLITKFQHIDIHQHWLQQEYAERQIHFRWRSTKQIITDSLTKALQKQRFNAFIKMIGMVNIKEHLMAEKRMEALKDQLTAQKKTDPEIILQLIH